jgi:hypothetical protein
VNAASEYLSPSGFMRVINQLKALGYPLPPPLVLEWKSFAFDISDLCVVLYRANF